MYKFYVNIFNETFKSHNSHEIIPYICSNIKTNKSWIIIPTELKDIHQSSQSAPRSSEPNPHSASISDTTSNFNRF